MKVNYDRAEDILMIETNTEGVIDFAEQSGPFIAHFSADGKLVLLEVLEASEFLTDLLKVTLRSQEPVLTLA